ncbi:MAG: hypothetical protein OEM84_11500 [Acidimicrobiia bacterium]|nr:hypothetical protein [Acidimicrobiia bacterium]
MPEWPVVEVLVTNQDGVFYVDSAGEVSQLVIGRVVYAVDDTRGGLLFQVERGRSAWWQGGGPLNDTVVWWVPQGSAAARELLVPTAGAGQDLALYDAFEGDDGHLRVVYVRSSTPEGEGGFFGQTDSLRVFDVETGSVNEVWEQGAYEMGFGLVSVGAGLLAATGYEQVGDWCFFLDPSTSESGDHATVEVPGAPPVDPTCEECCKSGCVLSPNGELLAYRDCSEVTVVDRNTDGSQQRFRSVERPPVSISGPLDLTGTYLLVNQQSERDRFAEDKSATLIRLDSGDRYPVPIDGLARFVNAPIDINGPVVPHTPAAFQLRHDGLGVVSFGESVDSVMAVLTGMLGPPDWEEIQISADTDLSVRWGKDGEELLYLQFTYWGYFDAAPEPPGPMPEGPVFHYYLTESSLFATQTDITVGSTVGDLKAAYRNVRFGKECGSEQWSFVVDPPSGWLQLPIIGLLDGEAEDSATRIIYLGAGWDRSPC